MNDKPKTILAYPNGVPVCFECGECMKWLKQANEKLFFRCENEHCINRFIECQYKPLEMTVLR